MEFFLVFFFDVFGVFVFFWFFGFFVFFFLVPCVLKQG